ncbi:phospholipase D-like domain-containing protein [Metallibacterium scheffleri]|uniref:phospholipase D-like domain-containing protein n=1 Tax=Metallibacterium scheffleri TaxID=993689 RepID=UPI0023EFA91D|nr:phospholipase D-like domain-containing protein [Metallibacterium scheffleri]
MNSRRISRMPVRARRCLLLGGAALLAMLLSSAVLARSAPPAFQIVESVPVGTIYGQPGVPRTQAIWLDLINHAQKSIDLAAFYISNQPGAALQPVLDALIRRAAAGVKVRILLDATFMKESRAAYDLLAGKPGIDIRILPVDKLTGGVLHAKYFIVDDHVVFVGSQNWDWRALTQIHEIGAVVRSTRMAKTFTAAFDFDWQLAADPNLPAARRRAVQPPDFAPVTAQDPLVLQQDGAPLVISAGFSPRALMPDWLDPELPQLLRLIDGAQHTLDIQVMTLSAFKDYGPKGWWPALDSALRGAAARGVRVRIIVADWALREPMQAYLKSLALMPNISIKYSTLPEAPQGFIPYARVEHCKYAVADDRMSYIGTGNWSWSYFATTVDASLFITGKAPAQTLSAIFNRDWNGPYVQRIEPGGHYAPPRVR